MEGVRILRGEGRPPGQICRVTLDWPAWVALVAAMLLLLAWAVVPALLLTQPARARRVQGWPRRMVLVMWAGSLVSWTAFTVVVIVDWQLTLDIDGLVELAPWLLALLLAYTLLVTLPIAALTVMWLRRGHRRPAPGRLPDHGHSIQSNGGSG